MNVAQEASGRSAAAGGGDPPAGRAPAQSRRRTGRHLSAVFENQVRRRPGSRLPLLQRALLCPLWRQSCAEIFKGKQILSLSLSLSLSFFRFLPISEPGLGACSASTVALLPYLPTSFLIPASIANILLLLLIDRLLPTHVENGK